MARISYDLHIHSCLSPCAEDDMTPANIVSMAVLKELDVIALTDHNTARNTPAFLAMANQLGILAIPGMELTTQEEVHVLCLFQTLSDALSFDAYVYAHLLKVPNNTEIFGNQILMNEEDAPCGEEPCLLINATDIGFIEAQELVVSHGGIMIPAHIEKNANSLLSNLGFIPPESTFSAAEVRRMEHYHKLKQEHPYLNNCRIITDSDAHSLGDIKEPVDFLYPEERSIASIFAYLKGTAR